MAENSNGNGKAATVRLELKTKIALMASVIFGTYPDYTEKQAVESAIKIQGFTDEYVDRLKKLHAA